MLLTAGQSGDNPQLLPLLDQHRATGTGGQFRLLGDKAYSHPSTRTALRRKKIPHTIPERDDQKARRKAKGSAGGRPPAFDADLYKHRNTVERGFNRLKQWRGIATRYDKHARTYLGGLLLAASVIHLQPH
jgi:transposase